MDLKISRKLFQKMLGTGNAVPNRKSHTRLFMAGLLPVALGTAFFFWGSWSTGRNFSRITEDLFRREMLENTLNMHYTVAYPENFGLENYEVVLPGYLPKAREEALTQTERTLESLNDLKSERLNDQDAYTHRLLVRSLNIALQLNNYTYYEEPLSPSSGMQTQLPILLAEYTFRSKRDVEDYLDLLDQTDEYFASLLTFQQEKAQAGLLQSASSLEKVRKQCDTIVTSKSLDAGSHFLQTTFAERLAGLTVTDAEAMAGENTQANDRRLTADPSPAAAADHSRTVGRGLTAEEIAAYTSEHNRLLKTVLLPAYEALSDGLFLLADDTIPLTGLAAKPQGREYYQSLLIAETGSYRTVEEVKALLTNKLQEEYEAMRALLTENPGLKEHFLTKQHLNLPFTNDGEGMKEMLADLQKRMSGDFPGLAETAATTKTSTLPKTSNLIDAQTSNRPQGSTEVQSQTTVPYSAEVRSPTAVRSSAEVQSSTAVRSSAEVQSPTAVRSSAEVQSPTAVRSSVNEQSSDNLGRSANPPSTTTVTIKSVDPSLEAYCAPAFYLTTPIDDTDTNVIYINQKNSPKGLDLYTTLAHEGYPGHLYQTVYNNKNFTASEEDPVRQLLWYGGYLEGWALYVEFQAYDYAAEIVSETNIHTSAATTNSQENAEALTESANAAVESDALRLDDLSLDALSLNALSIQLEKHNRNLQLCLFSILDIMIHYENASYNEAAGVLKNFGVENPDSAKAVYTYITEEPCNYLKYYLGYLEILELQKTAQALWGEDYSDYNFHKFYLDCGPSDFTTLGERLTTFSGSIIRND